MFILFVLYTLQGIPMGICSSLPVILRTRGISFEDLALLSLASVPFSLKLLWAPIVDSTFIVSMGRRKSWLVPIQILCGIVFLYGAGYVDIWMQHDNVHALTAFLLFLYTLMATQDIAVDGWALTMLSPENVGYGSLCNSIGQSFGFFLANQVSSYFYLLLGYTLNLNM
jgi:PAT family acetyl-CoA transporter-like MFS transporter 1